MNDRSDTEEHRLEVPAEAAGSRLDRFAAAALDAPRRLVMQALEAGLVRVDGRRARKGQALVAGQVVIVRLPSSDASPTPQFEPPLQLIHEDPSFLVVYKESGEATHPLVAGELGTLANRIVASFPECARASPDPREGGVAHRLDKPTSGLVVVARDPLAWESLRRQFSEREVEKEYLALVAGELEGPLELDVPIGGVPGTPGLMRAIPLEALRRGERAREAHTRVEIELRANERLAPAEAEPALSPALRAKGSSSLAQPPASREFVNEPRTRRAWTLVRCSITTGVMHQIRVHLAYAGHPVAGDDRYGGPSPEGLGRLFLHSALLGFRHPLTGEALRFESPLPPELSAVMRDL